MAKTWLITGASSGFWTDHDRAPARTRRYSVVATLRKMAALDDLEQQAGDRLRTVSLDVTDTEAVRRAVDRAFADMGRIDVVVSNAGYGLFGATEELGDGDIDRQIATNLVGSIQVIRAALPHLRAQGGGRVLQTSSEGGQIGYPNFSLYHATKWGIEGFVEAVAQEVAPFGIAFTIVEPGPTRTDFGTSLAMAPADPAYRDTPAGAMRRAIDAGQSPFVRDEPDWMVEAMIASVDRTPAPLRLVLGAGSFERIRTALVGRLAELEAQEATARGHG